MLPSQLPAGQEVFQAAVSPRYMALNSSLEGLDLQRPTKDMVRALSIPQARALSGPQVDKILKAKLEDELSTKWLMKEQECWYRPQRPHYASTLSERNGGSSSSEPRNRPMPDIAVLMVDNRRPIPYEVVGTELRSPESWGLPRVQLTSDWTPVDPQVTIFQMSTIINHIYSQLHGYRFYLENPCPSLRLGVDNETWRLSVTPSEMKNPRFQVPLRPSLVVYHNNDPVCPPIPSSERLGPFPPRGPPWAKLAAIRYLMRRHEFILYLDSDCFVTEVWQPLEPLLNVTGLLNGSKWIAAAQEFPPQKLRGDWRAGLANSGVLLMVGSRIAGKTLLETMERWIFPPGNPTWMFKWPFEQHALTRVFFYGNRDRYTLLRPGCPINSPFGAFLRHMVGGTPHRQVYHPDHRLPWLRNAVQCVVRGINGKTGAALERCNPNEPNIVHNLTGCVDDGNLLKQMTPIAPRVFSRIRSSDWMSCCGYCNADVRCTAWTFAWQWPVTMRNCMLLDKYSGFRWLRGRVSRVKASSPFVPPARSYTVPEPLF